MTVYRYTKDSIIPLPNATFSSLKIGERDDLQRLLRDKIEIIAPDTLVIAEEFCDWDDSRRRIDLLAIDQDAKLVVIELKRTEDGGHMDLQAIRYAAMVSTITFADAVRIFCYPMGPSIYACRPILVLLRFVHSFVSLLFSVCSC